MCLSVCYFRFISKESHRDISIDYTDVACVMSILVAFGMAMLCYQHLFLLSWTIGQTKLTMNCLL